MATAWTGSIIKILKQYHSFNAQGPTHTDNLRTTVNIIWSGNLTGFDPWTFWFKLFIWDVNIGQSEREGAKFIKFKIQSVRMLCLGNFNSDLLPLQFQ